MCQRPIPMNDRCFVCFDPAREGEPLLRGVCACPTAVHAACLARTLEVAAHADGYCAVCREPYRGVAPRRRPPAIDALLADLVALVVVSLAVLLLCLVARRADDKGAVLELVLGLYLGLQVTLCCIESWLAPRSALLAAQFVWTIGYIGWRYGYRGKWYVGVVFYVAAFAVSAPVTAAHELEPMSRRVPWHKAGRNGFHEDFHFLLYLADSLFTLMGVEFLLD